MENNTVGGLNSMRNQSPTYLDNKLTLVLENFVKGESDIRFYNEAIKELYKIFQYPRIWDNNLMLKLQIVNQYIIYYHQRYDLFDDKITNSIHYVFMHISTGKRYEKKN